MFQTEILIKGKLHPDWSEWFEEMRISTSQTGDTLLLGTLPDQSAVYGVISRLSSLGITLLSVSCHEIKQTGPP